MTYLNLKAVPNNKPTVNLEGFATDLLAGRPIFVHHIHRFWTLYGTVMATKTIAMHVQRATSTPYCRCTSTSQFLRRHSLGSRMTEIKYFALLVAIITAGLDTSVAVPRYLLASISSDAIRCCYALQPDSP